MTELRKGSSVLFTGWVVLLLSVYLHNIWLARTLGPALFGTYGVIMSVLLWMEMGVINGFPVAIQRAIPADPGNAGSILKSASLLQFIYILALFSLSCLVSPMADQFFREKGFGYLLRIAMIDVWFYGYYFIFISFQNGLKRFGRQAVLIAIYGMSKLGFVILFVSWLKSVEGALLANIAGSAMGMAAGWIYSRNEFTRKRAPVDKGALVRFAFPVALYSMGINLLMSVDLWMVKIFLDSSSGYYYTAGVISRVPYFLFLGLSSTVLPLLSAEIADGKVEKVKQTVSTAVRYFLIAVAPILILTVLYAREITTILFSSAYEPGAEVLRIMIVGMSFLAFFYLLTTMVNAAGRPAVSFYLTTGTVILQTILNLIMIPGMGMKGAAWATTIAMVAGSLAAALFVIKRFGVLVSPATVLRVGFAALLLYGGARLTGVSGIWVLPLGFGGLFYYGFLLILTKEIDPAALRRKGKD